MALEIKGYDVGELIHASSLTSVFAGRRIADGHEVALKTLNAQYPDNELIAETRREYEITRKLAELDCVINVHELVPVGEGSLAIVMDRFGTSLAEQMREEGSRPLNLGHFFQVATATIQCLDEIHQYGIVHTDLVPRNILSRDEGAEIRIIDFGLSSELSRERQGANAFSRLVGSLPYISPEQTGRTNRYLDYRSDYYSLGITFFELLTGRLPFVASDPLEWVHSHISKLPPRADELNPLVPGALADIVFRMMAKNAEDRYQSSFGLLHDLHQVRDRIAAGESLDGFVTAAQDHSRVFQIPQKLYGRQAEIKALMEIFSDVAAGSAELCLVSGHSGVGKSALISELSKPIVARQGFLVQGKYEQLGRNTPYLAIAAAMKGLVRQLLTESPDNLESWRKKIIEAVGANGQVLVELVPELEKIIGSQPSLLGLPAEEAQNRFQIVFLDFIKLFSSASRPLVVFLDDLQWSDAPTLSLIQRLLTSRDLSHLMLIGAYRSNEVDDSHPLALTLGEIRKTRSVRELALHDLPVEPVIELVAQTMQCTTDFATPLAELLHRKSEGNPFFIGELLRNLYEDDRLAFDPVTGHWSWDMAMVEAADISDNVVDFVLANLRKLSERGQRVLKLAACIGNSFDLKTLATVAELEVGETAESLKEALQRSLIMPRDSSYKLVESLDNSNGFSGSPGDGFNPQYKFQHDRVQQAAYALIGDDQKQQVHLSIGQAMQRDVEDVVRDERLVDIVDHLNLGSALINTPRERTTLSELNLEAGIRAQQSSAYDSAVEYLRQGLSLLPDNRWNSDYTLTRDLNDLYMQCAYQTGQYEECERLIELLLSSVHTKLEKAEVLSTRTRQYATMGKMAESIDSAIQGLNLLGMNFKANPGAIDVARERALLRWNLGKRKIHELIDSPTLRDQEKRTAMGLLMEIFPAAFLSGRGHLLPYQVMKAVNLCLRYGHAQESAFAYAAYGMVLCGVLNDPALGYEYGKLAVALNERSDEVALKSRVIYVYAMFVHHWSNHWTSMTPWFKRGIETGYQSGDLLYLAYSAQDCIIWDPSLDLETIAQEQRKYLGIVRDCEYQDSYDSGSLYLQLVLNLMGETREPLSMDDNQFDEERCLAGMRERQFMTGIANYQIYKADICYSYGAYDEALSFVEAQEKMVFSSMALPQIVRFYLVAFLTRAALYPKQRRSEQAITWRLLKSYLRQVTRWSKNFADNFLHIQYLMQAELYRLRGEQQSAMQYYQQAATTAGENAFLRDEALINELFGKYFMDLGQYRAAEGYLRSAHYRYYRLKAQRKVEHLESSYPDLLASVEPQQAPASPGTDASSSSLDSGPLDLATVMKASQAISGELVLQTLLQKVMQILLENAGGDVGYFIQRVDGELLIRAQARSGGPAPELDVVEVHGEAGLPLTIVNYVLGAKEAVVMDDACEDERFAGDPYIQATKPRSVICMPVARQRENEAVIYMENNLAAGVFTPERLEMMEMLASQASISIENAQLYDNLELKVQQRTSELAAALDDLKLTQSQLVQSEKMAGLGTLVAGVAHEINNPTNFVNLGAATLDEDLQGFRELLFELIGEDNDPEVTAHFREQFERFSKALANINEGTVRIRTIVRDLRTFSRLDEAETKRVPVVENLESTLRLVRAQYHSNVAFHCDFKANPEIECFPAQLNQVLMNLVMNACQAVLARYEGTGTPPENEILGSLTLGTHIEGDEIAITFTDTGIGMSEEVKQRIFEPFFTTKPVGDGTGMGMSISYQIIEKHNGRFAIESEQGVGTTITLFLPLN